MRFSRPSTRPAAAFTMIEIAMSLAIIGFALVAIIGILPQGMDVQKENRRETIINQDANYLVQAIHSGITYNPNAYSGFNDLTNYILSVTNYWTTYGATTNFLNGGMDTYSNNGTLVGVVSLNSVLNSVPYALTNGANIIGLLSTPEYVPLANGGFRSNYVVAYFHAMSGNAAEKYPQTNALIKDASFGYRLVSQVMPWGSGAAYMDPAQTNFADPEVVVNSNQANQFVTNWAQTLSTNGGLSIINFNMPYGSGTNISYTNIGYVQFTVANDQAESMFIDRSKAWLASRTQQNNLYDVRLLLRWLLLPNGQVGNGRQTYRTMIGGVLTNYVNVNPPVAGKTNTPFWYFLPDTYAALGTNSL